MNIRTTFGNIWKWIKENHAGLQVFLTFGAILLAWSLYDQTQEQVKVSREANALTKLAMTYQKSKG